MSIRTGNDLLAVYSTSGRAIFSRFMGTLCSVPLLQGGEYPSRGRPLSCLPASTWCRCTRLEMLPTL